MTIDDLRKQALMDGMLNGSGRIVDRLLDGGVDLPDVHGDFHVTINGIPVCLVDRALLGSAESPCQYSTLNSSFADRMRLKVIFPGAIVSIFAGKCPLRCGMKKAA